MTAEGKIKGEQCKECKYDKLCEGVWKNYGKIYGLSELKPVSGEKVKVKAEIFAN